jgi:hypothetical protein
MTAMIYMIFICNANAGTCQSFLQETFQSPQECVAAMVKYYGQDFGSKLKDGRLYTSTYQWFECEGKPDWQSVQ